MTLLTLSSPSSSLSMLSSSSSSSLPSDLAASALSASSSTLSSTSIKTANGLGMGLWWMLLMIFVFMAQQQPCECRYLPTRSHGDDLDKLRELMLQILESSSEDGAGQQRPANEANGNTLNAAAAAAQRANWLNKLGGNINGMDVPRKYNAPHGIFDNGRYY